MSTSSPMCGAAGGFSACAAAIRCWARRVADPEGVEGPPGAVDGLGLLDVETVLIGEKTLREVKGECLVNGEPFQGYEMHIGRTEGPDRARPLLRFADGRDDGAMSASRRIAGAYVHGLFADDRQRAAWLASLGAASELSYEATIERTLDDLADHCEAHLDLEALLDPCAITERAFLVR